MKKYLKEYGLLVFLLVIFLLMMRLMRSAAGGVAALSDGQGIIDLSFGISPARTAKGLSVLTPGSAEYYRRIFLAIDCEYAFCYCMFYMYAVGLFLKKAGAPQKAAKLLPLMPAIGAVSDLAENTVLYIMLSKGVSDALCFAFSVFCMVKFIFVYASLITSSGGLLWAIKKRLS